MNAITNSSFKSIIKGIDPISKGTFTIEYAYMLWENYGYGDSMKAQGKIVITSENDNPLFNIAKESPLRLQGLMATVDFEGEKRFIKIETISQYVIDDLGVVLNPVTFEILDNLEYLENVQEYKWTNLL